MAQSDKERTDSFELGRLAGIAEEHIRGLKDEITGLKGGQVSIMSRIEELSQRVESLNNWRWIVVGFASAVAFVISVIVGTVKGLWK